MTTEPPTAAEMRAARQANPNYIPCPKCQGLAMGCSQCNGWGVVKRCSPDARCIHVFAPLVTVGKCLHTRLCVKCGDIQTTDTSD